MISQAPAPAAQATQQAAANIHTGQLSADIIEDLSNMFLDLDEKFADAQVRSESKAFENGRSIEEIVQYESERKALPVWNVRTKLSDENQAKLIARADAGIKTYKKHGIEFASLLNKHAASKMGEMTHEQAHELLKAGGVDHQTSAQVGSAFDALIAAIPKVVVRVPVNAALGSDMQGLVTDAVNISGVSAATEESAARLAAAPLKSVSRVAVNTTMKSLTHVGWWGRSIPPGAEDMVVKPADIQRMQEQIAQLALDPSMTSVSSSPEQSQEELRKRLTEQLQTMQAEQAEFLDAMGVSTEQRRALVTAFGDAGVKIAARIGGGIALSAAGVPALTPLIAAVVYPCMAATTKSIANWQDSKRIARVAVHRYKLADKHASKAGETGYQRLVKVSHYMQDHFQHAAEASYHRKIENVLDVRRAEYARDIERNDYRIAELKLLKTATNTGGMNVTKRALKNERKINHLNQSFKSGVKTKLIFGSTLDFLKVDAGVVEQMIDTASRDKGASNFKFQQAIKTNAGALLTVNASPAEESVALFARFKDLYEARVGKALTHEFLVEQYKAAEVAMSDVLERRIDPLSGPDRKKLLKPEVQTGAEINGKRLDYLRDNLELVTERNRRQKDLMFGREEIDLLRSMGPAKVADVDDTLDEELEKVQQELAELQKKASRRHPGVSKVLARP